MKGTAPPTAGQTASWVAAWIQGQGGLQWASESRLLLLPTEGAQVLTNRSATWVSPKDEHVAQLGEKSLRSGQLWNQFLAWSPWNSQLGLTEATVTPEAREWHHPHTLTYPMNTF